MVMFVVGVKFGNLVKSIDNGIEWTSNINEAKHFTKEEAKSIKKIINKDRIIVTMWEI